MNKKVSQENVTESYVTSFVEKTGRPKYFTHIYTYMHIFFLKWNITVLYGCDTWYPKLRTKHRLRVFENGILRRIWALNGCKWRVEKIIQ